VICLIHTGEKMCCKSEYGAHPCVCELSGSEFQLKTIWKEWFVHITAAIAGAISLVLATNNTTKHFVRDCMS
jgi:hypothetical protein